MAGVIFLVVCQTIIPVLALIGGESMEPLAPLFETHPENITAISGETANLPCAVENKGEYKVIWMNPRKTLISTDDSRYIDDSRISVERPKIKDWNLMIREVRFNDSGEYMCQINTKPNVLIKRLYLNVNVPPEMIEDFPSNTKRVAKEGETIELVCNATGVPAPTVTWYKQADLLMDYTQSDRMLIGEVLILHNITRYCDGAYECNAQNGVEPTATKSFEVTVWFAPEVRLTTARLGQALGKETILECRVFASPHGSVEWKRNGTAIPNKPKYRQNLYNEGRHERSLTLNIINIEKEDFGDYTCSAENHLGEDRETMLLYEYKPNRKRPKPTTPRTYSSRTPRPSIHNYVTTPTWGPRQESIDQSRTSFRNSNNDPFNGKQTVQCHRLLLVLLLLGVFTVKILDR